MSNGDVVNSKPSSSDTTVLFDGDIADEYKNFEKQHFHPDGPFPKITNRVIDYATKNSSIGNLIVLDLASGHGEPARSIARAIPGATVYSTDISVAMNAIATEKLKDIPNIQTKIADMQDLDDFSDNSVDVATCCYGFMFPLDKKKAVQETFRVLKPGGMMVSTTWNNLPLITMFSEISNNLTGKPFLNDMFNPFSLAEPGLFEELIIQVGFDQDSLESSTSQYPLDISNDLDKNVQVLRAMDFGKVFENVDNESLRSTFAKLAPKFFKTKDDGTQISEENIFKFIVAFKPIQ